MTCHTEVFSKFRDVFTLCRGNYDHVTFANKDYFPVLPVNCAHMGNISKVRRDSGSLQPRSRLVEKTFSQVSAFVISCGVAM